MEVTLLCTGSWKPFLCPDNLIFMCEEESCVAEDGHPCSFLLQITVPQWFSPDTLTRLHSDMPDAAASVSTKRMKILLVTKLQTSARKTLTKGCNLLLSKALVLKLHHPNNFFHLPLNISAWKYLSLPEQYCSPHWQGHSGLPLGLPAEGGQQSRQHGVLMVHSGHLPPSLLPLFLLPFTPLGGEAQKETPLFKTVPFASGRNVFSTEQSLSVQTVTAQLVQGWGGVGGVLRFSFTSCRVRPCQMRQLKQPGLFVSWPGLGCEILGRQKSVCISPQLENTSHTASALSSFSGDLKSTFPLTKSSLIARFLVLDSLLSIWTDQRHT